MATYKITDTQQTQTFVRSGRAKDIYRVWLETGRGATGTVDVDPADWNAEALTRILTKKAEDLDLAFTLQGE
jgi:hypothetical protein